METLCLLGVLSADCEQPSYACVIMFRSTCSTDAPPLLCDKGGRVSLSKRREGTRWNPIDGLRSHGLGRGKRNLIEKKDHVGECYLSVCLFVALERG